VPDIVQMDPSWHHNYASLGFFSPPKPAPRPHYPRIAPELAELTRALHGLAYDQANQRAFVADPQAYAARFELGESHRKSLLDMDPLAFAEMGLHPLIGFLANMNIQRLRAEAGSGR
jgi:2,3-dihydroxyphenylpropionate 1,2-dioxygenase